MLKDAEPKMDRERRMLKNERRSLDNDDEPQKQIDREPTPEE
jgi:hypothetical protein